VIVAVITVRMVQPAVDEVVDMIAMRHRFMSASWTMRMCAMDLRRAVHRIGAIDRDDMFVDVILVHVVEMAIVQIVHVAVMANRGVPACRAMLVSVVGMVFLGAVGHRQCSLARAWFALDTPFGMNMVARASDAKVHAS
jgi:choline-glycine betaine transporter